MPDRDGEPMTERAGAHFHAGHLDVRVHAERRFETIEAVEDRIVDEARLREHRAERCVGMAFRQHEAVALRPFGLVRPYAHAMKVKRGKDIGRRARAAHVAAAARTQRAPDVAANLPGLRFKPLE